MKFTVDRCSSHGLVRKNHIYRTEQNVGVIEVPGRKKSVFSVINQTNGKNHQGKNKTAEHYQRISICHYVTWPDFFFFCQCS